MGILRDEITNKEKGGSTEAYNKAAGGEEEGDDDDDELKKIDGVLPITIGPDGAPMKRNNSDVMNNFFIMYAVRCFTDIEKLIKNQNTQDSRSLAKFVKQVEVKKTEWEKQCIGQFEIEGAKYKEYISDSLGLEKQKTTISGGKKTESTYSSKDGKEKSVKWTKVINKSINPDKI